MFLSLIPQSVQLKLNKFGRYTHLGNFQATRYGKREVYPIRFSIWPIFPLYLCGRGHLIKMKCLFLLDQHFQIPKLFNNDNVV